MQSSLKQSIIIEIMVFKKRRACWGPGHVPWNKGQTVETDGGKPTVKYVRLTEEDLQLTIKRDKQGNFLHNETETPPHTTMLLRPKVKEELQYEKMLKSPPGIAVGHRILDVEKLLQAINNIHREHDVGSPNCKHLDWQLPEEREIIHGLAITASFRCQSCQFVSTPQKLYREMASKGPGRKKAVPNMSLQVGLYQTNISGTAVRRLLTALSTPAPVMSTLQKSSNECGNAMVQANEMDMMTKRRKVREVMEYRGMERNAPVTIEIDRQYNTPLSHGRRKTPFQPATQARDVVIENVTSDKYVVAYNHTNKLCRFGQRMIREGKKPTCPNHPKCTANIRMQDGIGDERRGGVICAQQLLSGAEKLSVKRVVTDSDGQFAAGVCSVMEREAGLETEANLCVIHLNRSLARTLSNIPLSRCAFPAKSGRIRQKQQKHMADDIVHRFNAELKSALSKSGDISNCEKQLSASVEAILPCYVGQHDQCMTKSMVCRGKYSFPFLSKSMRHMINFNSLDRSNINAELQKRITPEMLRKTRTMSSTQKAESMNSAFHVTSPKNTTTYTRNGAARDSSAIQLTNSGPGAALLNSSSTANVPLVGGGRLRSQLKEMQSRRDYWRRRSQQGSTSRVIHRQYKYKLYEREHKWDIESGYEKGQLEFKHMSISKDHNYDRPIPKP